MRALLSLPDADLRDLDLSSIVLKAVHGWAWSADVLDGINDLVSRRFAVYESSADTSNLPARIRQDKDDPRIKLETLYPSLSSSISSHKRDLRLASLRLLLSSIVERTSKENLTLQGCLEAEVIDLDIAGVRERAVKMGKVSATGEGLQIEVAGKWLTGWSIA